MTTVTVNIRAHAMAFGIEARHRAWPNGWRAPSSSCNRSERRLSAMAAHAGADRARSLGATAAPGRSYDATQPSYAADLRAAALMSQRD